MASCRPDHLAAGHQVPGGVGGQPDPGGAVSAGGAADADEQGIRWQPHRFGAVPGAHDDRPKAVIGLQAHHLRAHPHINIRDSRQLIDEVLRHRRAEVAAADQQRDLLGVPGEPDDRLARRVAAAHHDDLGARARQRLARPGPVVHPRAEQVIDPGHVQAAPLDAAGEQHRPPADQRAVGQLGDIARPIGRHVDQRPGQQHFGTEPARLHRRARRQFAAADAVGKTEIVLDHRRGSGLAARRHRLDHDGAQALRCRVDGGGQAGRSRTDDRQVVFRQRRGRDHAETRGDLFHRRRCQPRPVRQDAQRQRRWLHLGDSQDRPHRIGLAGVDPLERVTVAAEEITDRVPAAGGRRARPGPSTA